MGLGGYLTWTAVARELHEVSGKKVFPFELDGQLIKPIKSEIFRGNPYIQQEFDNTPSIPMQLNNPATNYCKQDTPQRAVHRYDRHIIEQICEFYGIQSPKLKCEMYFSHEERAKTESILQGLENFIAIEPQSNDEYTVNKKYPLSKWQNIADRLKSDGHQVVQIGRKTETQLLDGVINLTGLTSFREAALLIEKSKLFVSSEGGLMHAANAVGTRSVIVYTGFIHPTMTCYPENKNIWIGKNHGPCGMKTICHHCKSEAENHDENEVVESVRSMLQ